MIRYVKAKNPLGQDIPGRATPVNTGKTYPANGQRETARRRAQATKRGPK